MERRGEGSLVGRTVAYVHVGLVGWRAEAGFDLAAPGVEVLPDIDPSCPAAGIQNPGAIVMGL